MPDYGIAEAMTPQTKYQELEGEGPPTLVRLPRDLKENLQKQARARGISLNLLVRSMLEREFPPRPEGGTDDLAEALAVLDQAESTREEVVVVVNRLSGQALYLNEEVLAFLRDLSPGNRERLRAQLFLLGRCFRDGRLDRRFLEPSRREPSIAIQLVMALCDSGLLTNSSIDQGTLREALRVLMMARTLSGDLVPDEENPKARGLLPGVITALVGAVVSWPDGRPLGLLEEPFRYDLHLRDVEVLKQRLRKVVSEGGAAGSRAKRMLQILRVHSRL